MRIRGLIHVENDGIVSLFSGSQLIKTSNKMQVNANNNN